MSKASKELVKSKNEAKLEALKRFDEIVGLIRDKYKGLKITGEMKIYAGGDMFDIVYTQIKIEVPH